ncbi:MAG: precorrin-6A reductase [Lachnospiraceae bacterium]|nr:precorrin-6A reductase [Lachnospiraceae bacterium]
MSDILIFAGTTEGRIVAELLNRSGMECDLSVATRYGKLMLSDIDDPRITVFEGRLNPDEMRDLYRKQGTKIVVDATHPYAEIVTRSIRESLQDPSCKDIEYIRLLRPQENDYEGDRYDDAKACAEALKKTEGNILLTTGSKELSAFCEDEELRKRIFARVLPGEESLKLCTENGLFGRQIIAMQGPFSEAMNEATIREFDIKHLVTKDSGNTGGEDTKIPAAIKTGAKVHIINRPKNWEEEGVSLKETIERLEEKLGTKVKKNHIVVNLSGIGCGDVNLITGEVKEAIQNADYIFGAERMLGITKELNVKKDVIMNPFYTEDMICPFVADIKDSAIGEKCVTVLFSGDTGFYSGCEKLLAAFEKMEGIEVKVLPGISSVSLLASRIGESYQDASILSLHGVSEDIWKGQLVDSVTYNKKTSFLCSGLKDVKRAAEVLTESGFLHVKMYVGYKLSYKDEKIYICEPENISSIEGEGLYVVMVINDSFKKRNLTLFLRDEDFIREKVPMTKEEIRSLSIERLFLKEGDVFADIGSGTGSVTVQAAALSPKLRVYALEKDPEAAELTRRNAEKFKLSNVSVINEDAPEGLKDIPAPDAAFIGGSGGKLKDILSTLKSMNPKMRVVINAVTLETVCKVRELISEFGINDPEILQVQINRGRKAGEYNLLQAGNPVFIFAFSFS